MSKSSPERTLKLAVTVDDFVVWDGIPMPDDIGPVAITQSVAQTLVDHGLRGTYGFSHTYRLDVDPSLMEAFELWIDAGHHLGNHTHQHAPLEWMTPDRFMQDIDIADDRIGHLIEQAPSRYFRYPMDMSSGSETKRGRVEQYLRENGYRNAPITTWFSDFAFLVPYYRAVVNGDQEAKKFLADTYVATAAQMLEAHATTSRQLFGADAPIIWLIHGTTIAADTLDRILTTFAERGVEFITLDEAMRHPLNFSMPPADPLFRNHLQRYAIAAGIPVPAVPNEVMGAVMTASPREGVDTVQVFEERMLKPLAARVEAEFAWSWE